MTPPDRIPVSVLTGFLGSGKTMLLNRLLKDPDLRDTAVTINEFGDVSIDHLLVEQSSDGVIELSDGCLCCTVRGELVDTLADLVDRLQTGRIKTLRQVVVETTGLADPAPVLHAITGHPVLAQNYSLDGVIVAVDAVNGAATLDDHEEAVKQVAVADRIVLTKTDLADGGAQSLLRDRLRSSQGPQQPLRPGDQDGRRRRLAARRGLTKPTTIITITMSITTTAASAPSCRRRTGRSTPTR